VRRIALALADGNLTKIFHVSECRLEGRGVLILIP
jgi:hypothetical protein